MRTVDKRTIEKLILERLPDAVVSVDGGDGKYAVEVVSTQFSGLNTVKRHQMIYASLQAEIESGALHALSIKARTPDEAEDPGRPSG